MQHGAADREPLEHPARVAEDAFIAAVGATRVIYPVGYRNRFGHPRPDVVARYEASGAIQQRTDVAGALSLRLGPAPCVPEPAA